MLDYAGVYFDLVHKGLDQTVVTDSNGKHLTVNGGIHICAERVYRIQKETKGLIFFCGNGASASMAEHMSHDWFQNAVVNTTTCSELAHVTAVSNDLSYENVFSYRIHRILSEKDMLVGISSSGNSLSIVNAITAAKEKGAFTVTVSGMKEDNKIRFMGDLNFYVPLMHYGEVESAHAVLLHSMLDYFLDQYMGGRH